jgi:hypothetical protein
MTPEEASIKPAALVWDDPFFLEQQLNDEERMIRDAAHEYCQDKLGKKGVRFIYSTTLNKSDPFNCLNLTPLIANRVSTPR